MANTTRAETAMAAYPVIKRDAAMHAARANVHGTDPEVALAKIVGMSPYPPLLREVSLDMDNDDDE